MNIAEILKDCPKGMELDCILFKDTPTYFHNVTTDTNYPIEIKVEYPSKELETFFLNKYGAIYNRPNAKCVIFPKGKTTWEGFQRPFKDGDIVVGKNCACSYIAIFRKFIDNTSFSHHACITSFGKFKVDNFSDNANIRFATEEEKQKLFDVIKDNGYKWNAETKTLEKLIDLKFKAGDRIKKKGDYISGIITNIDKDNFYKAEYNSGSVSYVNAESQDNWELVPNVEPKFKVGDKIRHKTTNKDDVYEISKVYDDSYGLTGFTWMIYMKDQDKYELVPNKFDISTLKPFDKVLVRYSDDVWHTALYSHYDKINSHHCFNYTVWTQCIPYNEETKHLCGTSNDCDEYYKTW